MAVFGFEAIIIGIIVLVILFWGPRKLPEIVRSLGRARKEFEDASKALTTSAALPALQDSGSPGPLAAVSRTLGLDRDGEK